MVRKFLILVVLFLPLSAHARQINNIGKYLLGTWKVEGVRAHGSTKFKPPKHAMRWTFNPNGTMIERLGKSGAKVKWHYVVIGHDIKVSLQGMAFTWQILGIDDKIMLIQHQLGLLKVRRM